MFQKWTFTKKKERAEQEKKERRQEGHVAFVETLHSADVMRGGVSLSRAPEEDAAGGARIGAVLKESSMIGKLAKRCRTMGGFGTIWN